MWITNACYSYSKKWSRATVPILIWILVKSGLASWAWRKNVVRPSHAGGKGLKHVALQHNNMLSCMLVISMLVIQLWLTLLASWIIGLITMWLVWITNASCSTCHFHARSVHWEPLALFLHHPIHFIQAFHVRVHCIMCLSTCPPIQAFWFPRLVAMSEDDEPNV